MYFDAKTIKWMTWKSEYEATFAEFLQQQFTLIMHTLVMVSMSIMKIVLRTLLSFMNLVLLMQL
jgi:hypothetical protein